MSASTERDNLRQPDPVVAEEHHLQRAMGPVHLTMIGIGSIIGAGIFVITGTAAAEHAGPAVLISFVIAGLGCLFAGLCYAEFASMIPESGSAYTYAYATMGRETAWFIGWNMVLEYLVSASTVAGRLVGLFRELPGRHLASRFLPRWRARPSSAPGFDRSSLYRRDHQCARCGAARVAHRIFLVVGVRASATFNGVMVLIKTGVVILVIVFGLSFVHMSNLTPFIPPIAGGPFGKFGISGILAASGMIFFAYIDFEACVCRCPGERSIKPRSRDLPIGILGLARDLHRASTS